MSEKIKVYCVETGETFDSLRDAATAHGVSMTTMSFTINGLQKTCKGLHFRKVDESQRGISTRAVMILVIETDKLYPSINALAKELNCSTSQVCRALKSAERTVHGYHIRRIGVRVKNGSH